MINRATSEPTTPQPNSATRSGADDPTLEARRGEVRVAVTWAASSLLQADPEGGRNRQILGSKGSGSDLIVPHPDPSEANRPFGGPAARAAGMRPARP